MSVLAHNGTARSDIVVELAAVRKVYHQRRRSPVAGLRSDSRADVGLRGQVGALWGWLRSPRVAAIEALRGVDLTIGRGEIVAYAGPNGAGKSTTIKLLAGLLAPDAGTVRVLGMNPLADRVRYVGRIGVVFGQRTELWWDHPVAASFEWKRVVWDIPRPRYERMLGFVKEVLGLGEFFESLPRELSLGQKMRADLGMALLHEPELLFLDEPTIGLDVLAKRKVLHFIKELNRERQMTVIVTSHDMSELEQLAGRIVLIHRGELAFDGAFEALRREFADRRRLSIETEGEAAPLLSGASLVASASGRHEYAFDASQVNIATLLEQAAAQAKILDVETHRLPIDDVIADIYQQWQGGSGAREAVWQARRRD
ncbi:MAG TPA: ATP-binding cassette domain-containing protein [Chloroflexota bacterium]|nr:ATP-binding cassette domain-containing protein [Chloroflexota bacterium]